MKFELVLADEPAFTARRRTRKDFLTFADRHLVDRNVYVI